MELRDSLTPRFSGGNLELWLSSLGNEEEQPSLFISSPAPPAIVVVVVVVVSKARLISDSVIMIDDTNKDEDRGYTNDRYIYWCVVRYSGSN